jgi:hypothetical protein
MSQCTKSNVVLALQGFPSLKASLSCLLATHASLISCVACLLDMGVCIVLQMLQCTKSNIVIVVQGFQSLKASLCCLLARHASLISFFPSCTYRCPSTILHFVRKEKHEKLTCTYIWCHNELLVLLLLPLLVTKAWDLFLLFPLLVTKA